MLPAGLLLVKNQEQAMNKKAEQQTVALQTVGTLDLTGATDIGEELAKLLADLLVKHGHEATVPQNVWDLLAAAHRAVAPTPDEFLILQEGGSSGEGYAHVYYTESEARYARIDSAKGAYNTSDIIKVPGLIAKQPGFMNFIAEVAEASQNLEEAESPMATIQAHDRLYLNVRPAGADEAEVGGIYAVALEEFVAAQPVAVRAAAALDIFFEANAESVKRSESGDRYCIHVLDHSGKAVTPDPDVPHGKWARYGEVTLDTAVAVDLCTQPGACLVSLVD